MNNNLFNDILDKEHYDGNIEYKRELINLDEDTFNRRITQMKYRLYEGNGEAFYFIGVTDDGIVLGIPDVEFKESIANLELIANKMNFNNKIYWDVSKPNGQYKKPSSNAKLINIGWNKNKYTDINDSLTNVCEWFTLNYPNIRGI
jgi:hypothetical protein